MKMRFLMVLATGVMISPVVAGAQDAETLADVRQELTVLNVEVQKLRRELSTTGGASVEIGAGSVLERVYTMESELQRLTSKTEELENRVNRVVGDGTNRLGDLNFRLCELEPACDIGALPEMTPLGGAGQTATSAPLAPPVTAPSAPSTTLSNQSELAVSEAADFERAQAALASGDFRTAADQFEAFNQTYPGGPLAAEAELRRGEALSGLGDTREAARAFLAGFSSNPTGPIAPQTLFELGRALGKLDQTQEACVTLSEVGLRFPGDPAALQAETEKLTLGCS
ncbi:tol-pal system protein YbgF [Sulfitobacter brevis]|uniref:Cell division coordinator CpoB n=2 Tax=Sulfitobacter brevis TaxID=74348 RepID=A0A1I2BM17_9RHOB|nr:tol-pal system protein YbgF [Sulfitobacter brevis]